MCIFPQSGKGRWFHLHVCIYQNMGNNLFQSLKRRIRHSVSISSEGRAAQPMLCPWQQKHNQEVCDSAFHILWEQTWGHVQQRHYLADNYHWRTWLTTSSDRSVVFHWLFNYIKIIVIQKTGSHPFYERPIILLSIYLVVILMCQFIMYFS